MMDFQEALRKAETWLDEIEGVEGIAQGKIGEKDCITVFVTLEETAAKIPSSLDGHPVIIEFTDEFVAQT